MPGTDGRWATSWFADPTFRAVYIAAFVAVLVGPMIWLSRWYHRNIGNTRGGQRLMRRQNYHGARDPSGILMAGDIERGRYGDTARTMQHRVYKVVGWWLLALAALAVPMFAYMPSA